VIGQEGDEDVRLDAGLELVKDRPDREIAFEVLERLLDRNQYHFMGDKKRLVGGCSVLRRMRLLSHCLKWRAMAPVFASFPVIVP
jgi:hypothetical protein